MADYRDFGGEGHYVSCIGPWACSCDEIRERSQRDAPKPWPSADRTAFTHGMELLDDPAILVAMTPRPADEVVIDGKRWRVIPSGFGYDDGSQSCRLVPIEGQVDAAERVQPPPHLTPEEVQEIRDWIATPPTSHVDDLIYRALRELSEIRQYEDPRDDGSYD